MNFKKLEDKCLYYRELSDYRLLPNSNIMCMLDGRSFSKLIKNRFTKPFDDDFISMMNETAKYVCENIQGAKIAYVQSDEISILITDYDKPESDSFFGFRLCKMQSIIASLATSKFNQLMSLYLIDKNKESDDVRNVVENMPLHQFDCKVWVIPTANDVFCWFLYRQNDCIRNSKQQAAQTYLSHKELVGKHTDEQVELLKTSKGVDWYKYNDGEKYGRFIYQEMKHMTKQLDNGQIIEFDRNCWETHNGFTLTEEENKELFYYIVPVLKHN